MRHKNIIWQLKSPVCYIFLLQIFVYSVNPVANNLHMYDGTSTADILGGDIFFEIIEPTELEYTYRIRPARDFGATFNESYVLKNIPLVLIDPKNGCTVPNNINEIKGNVVLVQRGKCSFKSKTLVAEDAGAKAVIITDEDVDRNEYFIEMLDDNSHQEVHIPAGFLLGKNGYMIRHTLEQLNRKYAIINLPVNLTFTPIHEIKQPPWLGW